MLCKQNMFYTEHTHWLLYINLQCCCICHVRILCLPTGFYCSGFVVVKQIEWIFIHQTPKTYRTLLFEHKNLIPNWKFIKLILRRVYHWRYSTSMYLLHTVNSAAIDERNKKKIRDRSMIEQFFFNMKFVYWSMQMQFNSNAF